MALAGGGGASTFLQYDRESGEDLERTDSFVERIGIEAIRAALLDEHSGAPAALRERLALAKAAVRDPWQEAVAVPDGGPFADLDEGSGAALSAPPPAVGPGELGRPRGSAASWWWAARGPDGERGRAADRAVHRVRLPGHLGALPPPAGARRAWICSA
jgi:hypothetical protein